MARRNPTGAWCGYVGIEKDHPLFGVDYSDPLPVSRETLNGEGMGKRSPMTLILGMGEEKVTADLYFDVHGSLTYSGHLDSGEDVWWFGFDCGHFMDFVPMMSKFGIEHPAIYRNLAYVKKEIESLADQLISYLVEVREDS